MIHNTDVIIIGAGAAGLMCAIEAGKRHRKIIILDHANKPGKKILMSGGGRCNFTNYHVSHENFISHNPHFCKSALHRYTSQDFIDLVKKHHIPFHEKAHGQLFCDRKSSDIVNMLLAECDKNCVNLYLDTHITDIHQQKNPSHGFRLKTSRGDFHCESLVIASGGLSIPTMGASPFGYKIAEKFGLSVWPTRAGLVPLTLQPEDKEKFSPLSGVSVDTLIHSPRKHFREHLLFTHRGLSGPAILQISSYWEFGEPLTIDFLPDTDLLDILKTGQQNNSQQHLKNLLYQYLPKRVIDTLFSHSPLFEKSLKSLSSSDLSKILAPLKQFTLKPNGTEGYRTAEVTLGGVDCDAISSKTMETNDIPGLYFIGEVLDVTGWLGGFNFQWAWSSGWAAGQVV